MEVVELHEVLLVDCLGDVDDVDLPVVVLLRDHVDVSLLSIFNLLELDKD